MKRDMELIRKILFYIEDNYTAGQRAIHIVIDNYSDAEIYEHCYLAYQAGLIQKPVDTSTLSAVSCLATNLTNAGYDLLDKIRDESVWKKILSTIKDKGLPIMIDTIKTVATDFITAAAEGVANSVLKNGGQ